MSDLTNDTNAGAATPADDDMDPCRHAVLHLWDYLDGRLPESERERVTAHLLSCVGCTSHYEFERGFLHAVRTVRRGGAEFDALRERVRSALRESRQYEAGGGETA